MYFFSFVPVGFWLTSVQHYIEKLFLLPIFEVLIDFLGIGNRK